MIHFQRFFEEKIIGLPERLKERYQLWKYVYPFVAKNRKKHPGKIICLFCQPRSGSTWLAELLLTIPHTCLMDEPLWRGKFKNIYSMPDFYDRKVARVAELDFYHIQPIKENEVWNEAFAMFTNLLEGTIVSLGMYNEISLRRLKNANTFIIKFNFAQMLLHWFVQNFDVSSILLLRHPCAVVDSQIKLKAYNKFIFDSSGRKFPDFRNSELFNNYEIVKKITTAEEQLAFLWAIQVKYSLYHPGNNRKWLTVAYERLLTEYNSEIERIFGYIGVPVPREIYDVRRKPSKSAKFDSAENIKSGSQLDGWKKSLSKKQISRILNVVEAMEVDIYDERLEPDYSKLYKAYS